MQVHFASHELERCYADEQAAIRAWGPIVGPRYAVRVALPYQAGSLEDLGTYQVLHLHPLKGERAGQWALGLQGRWRLIVELQGDDILVREVSNHYGD